MEENNKERATSIAVVALFCITKFRVSQYRTFEKTKVFIENISTG